MSGFDSVAPRSTPGRTSATGAGRPRSDRYGLWVEVQDAIAGERQRIADLIDSLSPAQLAVPSLCGDWTVQQVAGHLLAALAASPATLLGATVTSGFRLHRANARIAVRIARRPAAALTEGLRANADNPFRPPVVGCPGQLTDLQVHGQDMRRPLGLPHGLSLDRLRVSLDFLTGGRVLAARIRPGDGVQTIETHLSLRPRKLSEPSPKWSTP